MSRLGLDPEPVGEGVNVDLHGVATPKRSIIGSALRAVLAMYW